MEGNTAEAGLVADGPSGRPPSLQSGIRKSWS